MTRHKERILNDLDVTVEELREWHADAESQFGYECPGCHTCMVVIPELQRLYDLLTVERGGREK